jgi:hypothetical protein
METEAMNKVTISIIPISPYAILLAIILTPSREKTTTPYAGKKSRLVSLSIFFILLSSLCMAQTVSNNANCF